MCASGYLVTVVDNKNRSIDLREYLKDCDVRTYKWSKISINQQIINFILETKYCQQAHLLINSFSVQNYNNVVRKLNELDLLNGHTGEQFTLVSDDAKPYDIMILLNMY